MSEMRTLHKCPHCGRPATSFDVHFRDGPVLWNTGCHGRPDEDGFPWCFEHHVEWGATLAEAEAAWNRWCKHPVYDYEAETRRFNAAVSEYNARAAQGELDL
jgi:hypothetical protein